MSDPAQFQSFAAACMRMANETALTDHRPLLLNMAETWLRLAKEAERFEQLVREVDAAFDTPDPQNNIPRPNRRSH
jgi:hypothetical protein